MFFTEVRLLLYLKNELFTVRIDESTHLISILFGNFCIHVNDVGNKRLIVEKETIPSTNLKDRKFGNSFTCHGRLRL